MAKLMSLLEDRSLFGSRPLSHTSDDVGKTKLVSLLDSNDLCELHSREAHSTHSYSETESEREIPLCSCDEHYVNRCSYHENEHHGLNIEIADEFRDLKHLLRTIQRQEVRRYVYHDTQVGKVIEFMSLAKFQITDLQLTGITKMLRDTLSNIRHMRFVDSFDAAFVHNHSASFRRFFTVSFAVHPTIKFNSMACSLPKERPGLLNELTIQECHVDNVFFAALGSALHYSNAVTNLNLQELLIPSRFKDADLHLCWGWLVFGLFHPNSTAKIVDLDLSMNMIRMSDIRIVEGMMSGGHPANVLLLAEYAAAQRRYGKTNKDKILRDDVKRVLIKGIPTRRVFGLVKRGTIVRPLPRTRTAYDIEFDDLIVENERLEVFCLLSKWTCVVIPGFGLGWVPRVAVTELTEIALSPRICSPSALMRSVTCSRMIEDEEAQGMAVPLIALFLQMTAINENLDSLNLSHNRIGNPDCYGIPATEVLHRVLYLCPYLNKLVLEDCQLNDISPLVNAYRRGDCQIQVLDLDSNQLGFRGAFDLALLLINDRDSRADSSLKTLSLLFNDIDAIGTRALLESLQYNKHLQYLGLAYGNTFPEELSDFEFTGERSTWHKNHLFERLATIMVFEQCMGGQPVDEEIMLNMWELLGFHE